MFISFWHELVLNEYCLDNQDDGGNHPKYQMSCKDSKTFLRPKSVWGLENVHPFFLLSSCSWANTEINRDRLTEENKKFIHTRNSHRHENSRQ